MVSIVLIAEFLYYDKYFCKGDFMVIESVKTELITAIYDTSSYFQNRLIVDPKKSCECPSNHINCMTAKEWIKAQIGVWKFNYEKRDVRDKNLHPATFPISLATQIIKLFSHEGEYVLDPFNGSGTTQIAAQDLKRNSIGFDLKKDYVELSNKRLLNNSLLSNTCHYIIQDDSININKYIEDESISLIWTSPPYANLLNRKRKNKSRRGDERNNDQFGKVEQYSQDPRDLGTMSITEYTEVMGEIFQNLLPLLKPKGHCVINVPDMWWKNQRITIHVSLINELYVVRTFGTKRSVC